MTQNNLANLYNDLRRFTEAEEAYKEALETRKRLADKSPDAYQPDVAMTQNNLGILYIQTDRTEEGIDILKDVLNKRELLQDLGAGGFSVLGTGCERLGNRKEAAQCYLSSSASYFHLFTRGVDCSEAVLGNLVKTIELDEGEIIGDAATMLIALGKILGKDDLKDLKIPGKKSLSKRGEALKEALDGKKVDFDPEPKDEVDMMVCEMIKLLSF